MPVSHKNPFQHNGMVGIKRNIGLAIFFTIITCGIYSIYWKYLLVKNIRLIKNDDSSCTGEMLCLIFLPFYSVYWWYTRGETVKQQFSEHNYPVSSNGTVFLILSLLGLGIIAMAIMQNDFNSLPLHLSLNQRSSLLPVITILALIVVAALTLFLVYRGPKEQSIDFRDNDLTSSEMERIQNIANEAGRPGRGRIELLSYNTRYVKDEEGNVKELVVVGLLRNGYNTPVQINSLELTVKAADDETEIASAAFEGDYGVIGKHESIIWKFIFTEEFILKTDADLSKTINHLSYTFERK